MLQSIIKKELDKYSNYTNKLHQLLLNLLEVYKINYHIIESRTKSVDSIIEKLERKEIESIKEITDVSGLRIVLYYQDDVDKVVEIVKENFAIDEKNSTNKANLYSTNEFGYLSVHYIVSLNEKRNSLSEWTNYLNLKAEIQIRTVLQHSWASISHEFFYKKKYEIPKDLERKLYRLAGLFELADEQFLNIRNEHSKLRDKIDNSIIKGEIEKEEVNYFTINYLFSSENRVNIFNEIEEIALEAGFKNLTSSVDHNYVSEIVNLAKILQLTNIGAIFTRLENVKHLLLDYFNSLLDKTETRVWYGNRFFYVTLALLFTFDESQLDTFENENTEWAKSTLIRIVSTVRKKMANKSRISLNTTY